MIYYKNMNIFIYTAAGCIYILEDGKNVHIQSVLFLPTIIVIKIDPKLLTDSNKSVNIFLITSPRRACIDLIIYLCTPM